MNIQGTDIKVWKNWCNALENQVKKSNKEPLEKKLFEINKKEEGPDSLPKIYADVLKNILLLIAFEKTPTECTDSDILIIVKRVRMLIDVGQNDKLDLTTSED
jgi:hypothetical protein